MQKQTNHLNINNLLHNICSKGILCLPIWIFLMTSCNQVHTPIEPYSNKQKQTMEDSLRRMPIESWISICNSNYYTNKTEQLIAARLLGHRMRQTSNFTKAIQYHKQSLQLANELRDTLETEQALNNMGTNFRRVGALADASHYYYMSLQLADEFSDKESYNAIKNKTVAINGLGNIYLTLHYYDEAKKCFTEALAIEKSLNSYIGLAINYANIGAILALEQQYDSAFVYYTKSMEQNQLGNSKLGISLCYNAFGEIYEQQGLLDSARNAYQASYNLMKDDPDSWHWMVPCLSLGRLTLELNNDTEALHLLLKAQKEAERINAPEQAQMACYQLHQYYLKQHDYKRALSEFTASQEWENKVINKEQKNNMMATRLSYERDKSDREIKHLNRLNEIQKREKQIVKLTSFIIIILMFIALLLLFFYIRLQKKRSRELAVMNTTKDKFFSIISHDLKNPAIAQRNALQVIADNADTMDVNAMKQYTEELLKAANAQVELLYNLLEWAQLQMGRIPFRPVIFDLDMVMQETLQLMHVPALQKQISIVADDCHGILLYADYNMIATIIRNLLSNAIKFSHPKSRIEITAIECADMTQINVIDHGIGISPEMKQNLFRIDCTHSRPGTKGESGSGLGLSVCKDMVERNGGHIDLICNEGEGCTFSFTVPKAPANLESGSEVNKNGSFTNSKNISS